jgi:Protein of unknown function (DUF1549)/Protein of unknown function (DUF1553)
MMVHNFLRGWLPGRTTSLVAGFVMVGGLLLATVPSSPARDAKDAKDVEKKDEKKDVKAALPPPPWPKPLDLVIVTKDDQHTAQVADTVKFINDKLEETWKAEKVVPSRYAEDHEFLRRATLDIIGRIATPEEMEQFLKDPEKKRRSMLIERLLASEEYPKHWANIWSNWLLSRSGTFGRGEYHDELTLWLEDQFASNAPFNEIVTKLLTAKGKNTDNGAVNFLLAHVGEVVPPENQGKDGHFQMVPLTSRITKLFLGTQVQCAQCHDHPFYNNIKQKDFWGINAFLRQVNRVGTPPDPANGKMMAKPGPLELVDDLNVNDDAMVYFEKRNGVLMKTKATFLPTGDETTGGRLSLKDEKPVQGVERRQDLANFVVNHDMFPKEFVNRVWGVFLGRGFVNPVDDFNDQNKPSNPELLNELAVRFKNYKYDQKELIRWICNSQAYNLSCVANTTNDSQDKEALFSRMVLKSMSPEQLFESLVVATKAESGESKDAKKDAKAKWLDTLIGNFGDDEGNEVNFNGTVVQALLMMNGADINEAIGRADKGTVALALKKHGDKPAPVIRELFLSTLNRDPTAKETNTLVNQFKFQPKHVKLQGDDIAKPERKYQDLLWALVNSNEFLLNH